MNVEYTNKESTENPKAKAQTTKRTMTKGFVSIWM